MSQGSGRQVARKVFYDLVSRLAPLVPLNNPLHHTHCCTHRNPLHFFSLAASRARSLLLLLVFCHLPRSVLHIFLPRQWHFYYLCLFFPLAFLRRNCWNSSLCSAACILEQHIPAAFFYFFQSRDFFFSLYIFFWGGGTNQVCEVFYASPAESTLVLLPPLLIRKCDSAACKYIADWANLQGSLLHLAQPVGAGTTWYSGKGGEGRQEGSKGEIWNRYTISL